MRFRIRLGSGRSPVIALVQGGLIIPSINVLGAYFPEWMVCIVGGLVLTILIRLLLGSTRWLRALGEFNRVVFNVSLGVCLALLGWIICFRS